MIAFYDVWLSCMQDVFACLMFRFFMGGSYELYNEPQQGNPYPLRNVQQISHLVTHPRPVTLVALARTSAAARAGSGCACQLPCPLERVLPVSAKSWFGPSSSRGRAWPRAPGAFRVGLGRLSHGHVLTARMSTRGPILQCHVAACKKTQKTDRRLMRMLDPKTA